MSSAVALSPSTIMCSESEWQQERYRNAFLQHLLDHFEMLTQVGLRLAWSAGVDEAIWQSPQSPPWRVDRDLGNALVPIIYSRLGGLTEYYDVLPAGSRCSVDPDPITRHWCPSLARATLDLVHQLAHTGEKKWLLLSHAEESLQTVTATCSCSPAGARPILEVIQRPSQWVFAPDDVWFWPESNSEDCWQRFHEGLAKIADVLRETDARIRTTSISYRMTARFRDSLLDSPRASRWAIVTALAKRLHMLRQDASHDAGMNDEPVRGSKERRFRVSGEERIHYIETADGYVSLRRYYGPGEHDDGL